MVAQPCIYIKSDRIAHFKSVNFMVCKLYYERTIKNKIK